MGYIGIYGVYGVVYGVYRVYGIYGVYGIVESWHNEVPGGPKRGPGPRELPGGVSGQMGAPWVMESPPEGSQRAPPEGSQEGPFECSKVLRFLR